MTSIVVHYQEIALKGKNRPWFIGRLVRNLRMVLRGLPVEAVRPLMGRIEIVLAPGAEYEPVRDRLSRVFGVANFARAGRAAADIDALTTAVLEDLGALEVRSFRVRARRADKRFPLTSPQIERHVGAEIRQARGWAVNLTGPDLTVYVEVLSGEVFYFFGRDRGPGGLPVGASGPVVCLLSGGIDSPVAAWRMMKRGCEVRLVHFHSYPITSMVSQEKVRRLAGLLARWQLRSRLYLVPFGDLQRQIVLSVPPPLRVVIYRRFMVRIAEAIARRTGARALVTGDVVGQVASQTLENLAVIDAVAGMPILRPLVGMDKDEITAQAERLETYPISIVPDEDCCQVFTPRFPATRATAAAVEAAEQPLSIASLVGEASASAVVEDHRFPLIESPDSPGGLPYRPSLTTGEVT